MWAQLIKAPLKPGADLTTAADALKAHEQPGSGLLRELFMVDQSDPSTGYVLALFESEEKAREREQDPRRAEGMREMRALMGEVLAGAPDFTDLVVVAEWAPGS